MPVLRPAPHGLFDALCLPVMGLPQQHWAALCGPIFSCTKTLNAVRLTTLHDKSGGDSNLSMPVIERLCLFVRIFPVGARLLG